ncbi:hypothetical protein WBG06_00430 [Nocardioides sp. CCNWLW239]|uniref:hypothetical protein n=1 Tax=Nocardioides sp. CCNWLW239 TaxID=3128902 RepID=UPI00301773C0
MADPARSDRLMLAACATSASIGLCRISVIDHHHFEPDHPALVELQKTYAATPAHQM